VHDVAIQRLPVRFALDRAGLVGADGPTHAGSFDLAYLGCLPGFVLMAAADEAELVHMVATQVAIDDRPSRCAIRAATASASTCRNSACRSRSARADRARGHVVALLSLGTRLQECLKAAEMLAAHGLSATVADAVSPSRSTRSGAAARTEHEVLITIEEGAIGGFGAIVMQTLAENGALDRG
jgi:1-deoxy-D-xylulose-5-phosphate synthase